MGPELHGEAWRNGVSVADGTRLQLMCCAPSRRCPNFGGQEFDKGKGKDKSTREY